MKKIVNFILLFLAMLSGSSSASNQESYYSRHASNPLVYLEATFYGLSSSFIGVALHELSHAGLASVAGADNIKIHLGLFSGNTKFTRTSEVSDFEMQAIFLGGYSANRVLALGSNSILDATEAHGWESRWAGTFYLVNRLYVVSGGGLSGLFGAGDLWDSAKLFTNAKLGRSAIVIGYAALIGLDVFLTWDQIKRNWNRAIGKEHDEEGSTSIDFLISPRFVAFQYNF